MLTDYCLTIDKTLHLDYTLVIVIKKGGDTK